jgi:formamidopyrimidine-DNA glycosylase
VPELPDIEVYLDALRERIEGCELLRVRMGSPFLLRSVDPPIVEVSGRRVTGLRRLGKRIVFEFEEDLYLVLHLMIAGRLRWNDPGAKLPRKLGLAAFDFEPGSLIVTEASKTIPAASIR